jgi:hypothetical protein
MSLNRRDLLKSALGGVALKALATGLPLGTFLAPRPGRAQTPGPGAMLILFTSGAGDPINANVPGTYGTGAEQVVHSPDATMAPTTLRLSGRNYTAAKPWADLPQATLDRTVFFHHATYTPVHQDQSRVMKVMGETDDNEMFASLFAKELAPRLGTVQSVPLSLGARSGSELLSAGGQVLANVGPQSIRRALGGAQGPLAGLQGLRDREIDRLYGVFKKSGTKNDLRLLDGWARSRDEVRGVSDSLLGLLDAIDGDDDDNQVVAAPVLAAMNITPVITIKGSFGGDNHNDTGLAAESAQHVSGVARMQRLLAELDRMRSEGLLRHEVVISTLNVFGRTLKKKGTAGRDHNRNHHVTVMMGSALRGGVVGGIELGGGDFQARSIDSTTGAAGGDIPFDATLGSMAKTLGTALGVSSDRLDAMIRVGKPVASALV